jgi:hypothetical protein
VGTGERVDQIRGRDRRQVVQTADIADGAVTTPKILDDAVTAAKLANDVYGNVAPSAIDPDDAAAAGTVGGQLSPVDHQHAAPAGTPSGLILTGTSAEGSGASLARNDHQHATDELPWGILTPRQNLTSNSAGYATGATTDFSLAITVDNTRAYRVHLVGQISVSGAGGTWAGDLHEAGTAVARMFRHTFAASVAETPGGETALYLPASSGAVTIDIRLNGTGGGTFTYLGSATAPRAFWVEDIGPR